MSQLFSIVDQQKRFPKLLLHIIHALLTVGVTMVFTMQEEFKGIINAIGISPWASSTNTGSLTDI